MKKFTVVHIAQTLSIILVFCFGFYTIVASSSTSSKGNSVYIHEKNKDQIQTNTAILYIPPEEGLNQIELITLIGQPELLKGCYHIIPARYHVISASWADGDRIIQKQITHKYWMAPGHLYVPKSRQKEFDSYTREFYMEDESIVTIKKNNDLNIFKIDDSVKRNTFSLYRTLTYDDCIKLLETNPTTLSNETITIPVSQFLKMTSIIN